MIGPVETELLELTESGDAVEAKMTDEPPVVTVTTVPPAADVPLAPVLEVPAVDVKEDVCELVVDVLDVVEVVVGVVAAVIVEVVETVDDDVVMGRTAVVVVVIVVALAAST